MLPDIKDLTYEERLRKLKLPSLRYRRLRGDMIETFKIVTGIYDKRVTEDLLPVNKNTSSDSWTFTKANQEQIYVYIYVNIISQTE